MSNRKPINNICLLTGLLSIPVFAVAQAPDADGNGLTPREVAPIDLTGYWTAVVTEDWRWRMMTPPKGDFASVPLNPAGQELANAWEPDGGNRSDTCMAYGAAGVMRMPLRVRITWEDDFTLRIDTDHGMQTRLLRFTEDAAARRAPRSLQGYSQAQWAGNPGGRYEFVYVPPQLSYMQVQTTNLEPGYLRKNGVPYSENAVVTEYFDYHADFGDEWFTVTTIVDDPTYLFQEFITSSSFKKLDSDSSWNPVSCEMSEG